MLFQGGKFQWERLENLVTLAKDGGAGISSADLTATVTDGARVVLLDDNLRRQLLLAFTEDGRLHLAEAAHLLELLGGEVDAGAAVRGGVRALPSLARQAAVSWSDRVLSS